MNRDADILFVTHTARLGGAELYLVDALEGAPERAAVLVLEEGPLVPLLSERGIPVQVLPMPSRLAAITRTSNLLRDVLGIPELLKMVGQMARIFKRYRLIYANSQKAFMLGGLAARWAGRPLLWNLHDILSREHFSRWHIRAVTWASNRLATRIIVNSRASLQSLREAGSIHPHIHVIYNGIDPTPFLRTPSPHRLPLLEVSKKPLVGVFGRLAPWKGQHLMLSVLEAFPEMHVVFVGDALFPEDRSYAERLKKEVSRRGLSDRVHWAGFQREVYLYFHRVDVVVHTSISPEPFGRVIVEGMMAGKPVVAAAAGGVPELLTSGSEGLLYPPGDVYRLIGHIRALLDNPIWAQSLGARGRVHALQHFHVDRMRAAIWKQINDVLTSQASTRNPVLFSESMASV